MAQTTKTGKLAVHIPACVCVHEDVSACRMIPSALIGTSPSHTNKNIWNKHTKQEQREEEGKRGIHVSGECEFQTGFSPVLTFITSKLELTGKAEK